MRHGSGPGCSRSQAEPRQGGLSAPQGLRPFPPRIFPQREGQQARAFHLPVVQISSGGEAAGRGGASAPCFACAAMPGRGSPWVLRPCRTTKGYRRHGVGEGRLSGLPLGHLPDVVAVVSLPHASALDVRHRPDAGAGARGCQLHCGVPASQGREAGGMLCFRLRSEMGRKYGKVGAVCRSMQQRPTFACVKYANVPLNQVDTFPQPDVFQP